MRPYAKRMMDLRAAKSPPCGCGDAGHDHSKEAPQQPPVQGKPANIPGGHKGVGAIDSRGA